VLGEQPISRVLSSPAVRCLQTAAPVARRLGLEIEVTTTFAEGAPLQAARALVDAIAAAGKDAIIFAHGDLIPDVLHDLELEGVRLEGAGCGKGSVWHLQAEHQRFVRAVYHRRPDPALIADG
jgi:8-oxo-dGTP diphosphatase